MVQLVMKSNLFKDYGFLAILSRYYEKVLFSPALSIRC